MKNISDLKKHRLKIILFSLAVISGFILGCLVNYNSRIYLSLHDFSDELINKRIHGEFYSLFINSLLNNLIWFLIIYFVRFFRAGVLCVFFSLAFYGFEKGTFFSCIFLAHGLDGMLFLLVSVFPGMFFFICSLIYSVKGMNLAAIKKIFVYIFCLFFTAGLDVTFTAFYKLLIGS